MTAGETGREEDALEDRLGTALAVPGFPEAAEEVRLDTKESLACFIVTVHPSSI